jgi:acyl-homoserine lactone acylase PvdQ
MEEQFNTPAEPTTEPVVNTNGTPDVQPTETDVNQNSVGVEQGGQDNPAKEVRKQNWSNGQRRINQRQSLKARVRELEEKLKQYEGKDDDYSKFQADNLQERINDMRAVDTDAEVDELYDRAEPWFGEDTEQFVQNVGRYAQYVNANEPDLLRYYGREYGPILLHEWMKRMDIPQARGQWLQFTTFEKQKVLDNLYTQIAQVIKQSQAKGGAKPQNVPVPTGGRQSPSSEPSDDFGIELGRAFNRHKG